MIYDKVWPGNLAVELGLGIESLPLDFEATLEYVIKTTMTLREHDALLRRYKGGQTLKGIGEAYGYSKQYAHIFISNCLRKLKSPSRMKVLSLGLNAYIRQDTLPENDEPDTDDLSDVEPEETEEADKPIRYEPPAELEEKLSAPIEALHLPTRAYNCVKRWTNVRTVRDLATMTVYEFRSIKDFGKQTQQAAIKRLEAYGVDCTHLRKVPALDEKG